MVTAAGGVLSASLVVTARLRAVAAFRRLTSVLLTSNNAFIRVARSALITSGVFEVLRRTISLLTHPVTGLLALLQTGLATRRWLLYEQALRNARVQLSLMGIQAAEVNRRLSEMTSRIGRLAAKELFQASLSLSQFFSSKIPPDLQETIQGIIDDFETITSIDPETLRLILTGLKMGGDEALTSLALVKEFFPGLVEEGNTLRDVFEKIATAGREIASSQQLSNLEKLRKKLDEINNTLDPFLGKLGDLGALIPLVFVTIAQFNLERFAGFLGSVRDAFQGVIDILGEVLTGLGELVVDILKLDFGSIQEKWTRVWDTIRQGVPQIIGDLANVFTAGFNEVVGDLGDIVGNWISNELVPAFVDVFTVVLPRVVSDFFVEGIGGILLSFFTNIWQAFWNDIFPQTVMNFITSVSDSIGDFFTNTLPAIILSSVNFMIAQVNRLITLINSIPIVPNIPGIPGIPGFQKGGIVPGPIGAPTLAIVHGGERITPSGGGGELMVVNVYIGEEKLDTILMNRMTRMAKRAGINPRSTAHL